MNNGNLLVARPILIEGYKIEYEITKHRILKDLRDA